MAPMGRDHDDEAIGQEDDDDDVSDPPRAHPRNMNLFCKRSHQL